MQRCQAYVEAGADMLFVEALRTSEQAERAARSFDVPLLYNFVETGKSPLLSAAELEKLGFKLVIFPVSALLTVCCSVLGLMRELKETGTTAHLLEGMVSLEQCFETVGLAGMLATDAGYSVLDTEAEGRGTEVKGIVDG
jgi:methylisocitrate lyase